MQEQAYNNRAKIEEIRARLNAGQITYEEAKELCAPIIEEINAHAKALAKKYQRKPQYVSFGAIMR